MSSEGISLQSPVPIPARTSSYNLKRASTPQKIITRPLSEIDWLAQSRKSPIHPQARSSYAQPAQAQIPTEPAQSHTHTYPVPMSPPPPDPLNGVGENLIHQKKETWSEEKEKILLAPFDYLLGHPGKDIRAQLIAAFNAWLKVPEESLAVITKVVGMLHTASLLVDDVEDSSILRRGVPVAHSIFGTAQTINSANYVYFLALRELSQLKNPKEAIDIYTEELLNLHRGQGMDLFWRDTLTCPSEADYLEMVGNKTGGLFRLAVKLMQCESECGIDCTPLVSTTGLLFQILDDYLNLSSPTYTERKGLCEDLTEGKFSFPIIHGIRADTSNLVLLNILRQKTEDEQVKRYAVDYLERVGSFEYTRTVMKGLAEKAGTLVQEVENAVAESVGGEEGRNRGREGAEGIRKILGRMNVQ